MSQGETLPYLEYGVDRLALIPQILRPYHSTGVSRKEGDRKLVFQNVDGNTSTAKTTSYSQSGVIAADDESSGAKLLFHVIGSLAINRVSQPRRFRLL